MTTPAPLPTHSLKVCRGASGCPHAVMAADVSKEIDAVMARSGWSGFLASGVKPLRHHHQFRLAVASCPNGCSQPHIADFGLIAAARIGAEPGACTACGLCVEACAEKALDLRDGIRLDPSRCLGCEACVRVCPSGALRTVEKGWRVLLGGKLGRHPRLAHELGVYSLPEAMGILERALRTLMTQGRPGLRLGDLIERMGRENFDAAVRP